MGVLKLGNFVCIVFLRSVFLFLYFFLLYPSFQLHTSTGLKTYREFLYTLLYNEQGMHYQTILLQIPTMTFALDPLVMLYVQFRDEVYIDELCELLIRRSNIRKFPGQLVLQTLE